MTFGGAVRHFQPFVEQLEDLVLKKNRSDREKFMYFLFVLRGKAAKFVREYSLGGATLIEAVASFIEQFGNPEQLVKVYYEELSGLPVAQTTELRRNTREEIRKIVSNLTSAGSEMD